jgi:hypothetical protein
VAANGLASVEANGSRLRWGSYEFEAKELTVRSRRGGSEVVQEVAANQLAVGELRAHTSAARTAISWREGQIAKAASAAHEGTRTASQTRAGALGGLSQALRSGDRRAALRLLADDPARAAKHLERAAGELQAEALGQLGAGDVGDARRLFAVAGAHAAATPELRFAQALANLENGLLKRGREQLRGLQPTSEHRSPLFDRVREAGFSDAEISRLAAGQEVAIQPGTVALIADAGRSEPLLRVHRPLKGKIIGPQKRSGVLAAFTDKQRSGETAVYIDDRFSLNRNDLLEEGEGVIGHLMADPHVMWTEVDVPLGSFTPERLAFADVKLSFRHVPEPRRLRALARDGLPVRRVVTIQRCDPEAPPGSPDACVR